MKNTKKFLGSGHIGRLEEKTLEEELEIMIPIKIILPIKKIPLCPHNQYCNKRKIQGYNCFLKEEAKSCGQVKRFYDKYKEGGNHLGVGS